MSTTTLARRQVRLASFVALQALDGCTVLSPGDWDTPPKAYPEIKVRCGAEQKNSVTKQQPEFTTAVTIEVLGRVQGTTDVDAQDQLESLDARIEAALLGAVPLITIVQQVASVHTQVSINSDGQYHVGSVLKSVVFEVFEHFDPIELDPSLAVAFEQINLHADLAKPFDKAGTYASPPFPDSVAAAPRTSGPDGRDEGYLQITLPTT